MTLSVVLLATFNLVLCHPLQVVQTEEPPLSWSRYQNFKYGFSVEVPSGWHVRESVSGIQLKDPRSNSTVEVVALPEISPNYVIQPDDYALHRFADLHPYLSDEFPQMRMIATNDNLIGCRIEPIIKEHSYVNVYGHAPSAPAALITYLPAQFMGDRYASFVEISGITSDPSIYDRVVDSYRHVFRTYSQKDLLAMRIIDSTQIPHPSVYYVGESKAYDIDLNGDGVDEMVMVTLPRPYQTDKERCELKVFERSGSRLLQVASKSFTENSFHTQDIQVVNVDNRGGYDVFLRFFEFGNEWGKNSNALVFHDGKKYRIAEFGAFAEAIDINHDGTDEILTSINTYFSLGAVATWKDIYIYENGDFVERNLKFPEYFRDVALGSYLDQAELVQSEAQLSVIPSFKQAAYRLLFRLQKYITWSQMISEGREVRHR